MIYSLILSVRHHDYPYAVSTGKNHVLDKIGNLLGGHRIDNLLVISYGVHLVLIVCGDGTHPIVVLLGVVVGTLEQEFLDFIDSPDYIRWKPLFVVMFGTGGRVGEIIGLRWKDVDFEKNEISINHSVSYYPKSDKSFKCEFEVHKPKTKAGIRTIPMLGKVQDALKQEKENQEKYGYSNVVELDGMSGFIFCNRFGNLHNAAGINRQIKRIVDDHNCREEVKAAKENREPVMIPHFSCHITRHTFCTRLCESETNIKVIQSVMGHKDIQTTMDIYAEVSEQKKQDVFKKLDDSDVF